MHTCNLEKRPMPPIMTSQNVVISELLKAALNQDCNSAESSQHPLLKRAYDFITHLSLVASHGEDHYREERWRETSGSARRVP